MAKILVLGAGMVGSAMAKDLSKDHNVTSLDVSLLNLEKLKDFEISLLQKNVSELENFSDLTKGFDLVLNALPGFMGYEATSKIIDAKKDVVDISFFPEDCFGLDEKAKNLGVTAIVDFGVAPGIPNMLLGYHNTKMEILDYKCYVGGLPKARTMPFQYKAPFSPADVIEEYTRPARYVRDGKLVTKEALSEAEYLEFEGIGTLEAFNTDGLRSLLFTNSIPNKIEKTLRYPGHIDIIKMLIQTGFFDTKEININGLNISPLDFTSKILFDKWKLMPGEEEFTVMRIIFDGREDGKNVRYEYNLHTEYNKITGISSMAQSTGYAATAAVNLLIKGLYKNPGINPPEYVGKSGNSVDFVLNYMNDRNVKFKFNKTIL